MLYKDSISRTGGNRLIPGRPNLVIHFFENILLIYIYNEKQSGLSTFETVTINMLH